MPIQWLASEPLFFLAWVVAIIVTLTIHEFSHALVALYFGDHTAKDAGRLTLNPLVHIDSLGFIMLLFAGFGWAKPVPVNPYNFKDHRLAMAVVSLAGPLANLAGVIVFGLVFKFIAPYLGTGNLLLNFLYLLILVNVSLFIFNLFPIPPLDGSKVLFAVLPDKFNDFKDKFSEYGPYILLILVLIDSFSPVSVFGGIFNWMQNITSWLFF
ncbi:MAG: site-2 protease family protein [Candidatus Buchananbacteria bacterium]|jgi:Zn-dependent protease